MKRFQNKTGISVFIAVMVTVIFAGTAGYMEGQREPAQEMQGEVLAEERSMEGEAVLLYTGHTDFGTGEPGVHYIRMAGELKTHFEREGAVVVLLDAGNAFYNKQAAKMEHATPSESGANDRASSVRQIIKLMNASRYDAVIPGDHDVNIGVGYLKECMDGSRTEAQFPIISSNILSTVDGKTVFAEAGVIDENPIQFGFLGLTSSGLHERGIRFEGHVEAAKKNVDDINTHWSLTGKEMNYIVAVVNLERSGENTAKALADTVPGIDILIDGNCAKAYEEKSQDGTSLIVGTGEEPLGVGYVKIDKNGAMTSGVITEKMYQVLTGHDSQSGGDDIE